MAWLAIALLTITLPLSASADDTLWTRSLGVEEGLSQNYVIAIAQDREGFLWFGTISGLNRWDGYRFESYAPEFEKPTSLSAPTILALHADDNGNVWVGTTGGLDRFDPATNAFERYGHLFRRNGHGPPTAEGIASDRAGRIWFASFAGASLYQFDPRTGKGGEFVVAGLTDQWVTALHVDSADRLWVAMQPPEDAQTAVDRRDRLLVFDRCSEIGDGRLPAPRMPVALANEGGKVVAIVEDKAHRLWFARNGGGLTRSDPRTGEVAQPVGDAAVHAALVLGDVRSVGLGPAGEIWALTHPSTPEAAETFQLFRVDPDTLAARRVTVRDRVVRPGSDARLERLAIDRSGVLWLTANAGGLRYADVSAGGFSLYRREAAGVPGLASSFVRAVVKRRDGSVWVGTPRGLSRIDRSNGDVRYSHPSSTGAIQLPDPDVKALHEDRAGNLWISTPRGLLAVERSSGRLRRYRHEAGNPRSLDDDLVQVIHEDHDGRLWVGTLRGLSEFDPNSQSFTRYTSRPDDPGGLPSAGVTALFSDARNGLWVGTTAGLLRLDLSSGARRFVRVAPGAEALRSATVLSIGESTATPGVLWIGTEQRGLCRLDRRDESVRFYTSRNSGLADNTIYGILSDRRGILWMSTNRGLVRYDAAANDFRVYGPARGLQSSEFNAVAFFQAPDGEMFFGGVGGLNAFYPDRIADNPHRPAVLVTEVRVFDREAKPPQPSDALVYRHGMRAQRVEIGYARRDISFEYVALHYSHAERNRYLYKLDNYDADWRGPAEQRSARYTNLDPGAYTFRVKALSSHGVPSDGEATFSFVVLPPFYATAWFRAVAALGVLLALAGSYQLRVRRLRRRQQELEREVAQRTEDLRQALATLEGQAQKLKDLDAAKSRFFANISHEFRTPLTLTLGPLRDVQAGRHGLIPPDARGEIETAIRNTTRQLELVDQLLALARLDAGQPEFRPRELRLDECVRLAAASYESLARHERARLEVDLPDVAVRGLFDEEKVERVIGNLLGNALKFTPPGGLVALRLRADPDGWATIEVEDTGPGIPAQDLPRVFERFYRGEQGSRHAPGTGIGLALAKEYVDLHGGEIHAETRPGGGTRVTVRLRASAAAIAPPLADATVAGTPAEGLAGGAAADLDETAAAVPTAAEEPESSGRPSVLVVDDHADMRAYVRKHLAPHYQVLEAARGDEALGQVGAEMPDVIVSDVMMPGLDGYAFCRALKADPETNFIPVILLTAKAGSEGRLEGLTGGADDYVTKPFEPAELLARIRNLLLARERLKARFARQPARPALTPTPLPMESPGAQFAARLREVLDQQSQDEDFGVEALAAGLGMSRAQVHRRIREVLGSTPAEVIIRFRLERAAQALAQRAGNVSEVAYAVGFKNLSHFVRRFREQYGQTPAAYRPDAREPLQPPVP